MPPQHHKLAVSRTAHYSTHGTLSKKSTKYIWIACHGYGQLAKKMIDRFTFLDEERHFVIALEGLNRFYWHENNKPAACWMTSEDRYDEITDFVNYMDSIYNRYCMHVNQGQVQIVLFGFSQGCATIWRWIHASQRRFDYFINWAGWIPEDISYAHVSELLNKASLYLHYGSEDHFITKDNITAITDVIAVNDLDVQVSTFVGGHVIPGEEMQRFVKKEILK